MKSVLISIRPKWCELIASGEKTIEVRKTRPEIETPFKCYIYETKNRDNEIYKRYKVDDIKCGKVIGEFVCDSITDIKPFGFDDIAEFEKQTCLTSADIVNYLKGFYGYGWHISDLKIYDKPKELSEFRKSGFMTEEEWLFNLYPNTHCHYEAWAKKFEITRSPQSWCYVEELI